MKNRLMISFFIGIGVLLLIPLPSNRENVNEEEVVGIEELIEVYVSSPQYDSVVVEEELVASLVGKIVIADTDSFINIRSGPGIENSVVGLMAKGSGGQILEEVDSWYYISSGAVTGFVCKEYFHEASQEESLGFSFGITLEEYNQQIIASTEAARQTIISEAQTNVVESAPEAYIDSSSNATIRESLVNYSMQFQNIPYVYGGSTMAGLDCSGFTMLVYSQFGQNLPHNSGAQSNLGIYISPTIDMLLPGDILYRPGHVALYIGNGQIIHASNSSRKIIVTSMSCMSWSGARRIIN